MSYEIGPRPPGEANERGGWLRGQCYACGHRLRFDSTGCPQCGEEFHGNEVAINDVCECPRCSNVRHGSDKP